MKTNLALIGFMGAGKSATGELLSGKLGKAFVELDQLIEEKAGKSAPQIFATEGVINFREREIEAVKQVASRSNLVIACGGGVVLNSINIDRLKKESIIVYLTASPAAILERTRLDGQKRPLLQSMHNVEDLKTLIKERRPFYERAADFKVDTSHSSAERVAEKIIARLEERADWSP